MPTSTQQRIAVLPSAVADQIAAGEVIERPASVVKELVENSLDAGALAIDVAVEDGGRARIRIADDGCGMSRDDALLALQRYATSKIRDAGDLVGVRSFGFRGEALPAIASISELELHTAERDGDGTIVRAAAGTIAQVEDAARRRGTTVTVSRIFFNAPARAAFLRSARGEWRGIMDSVTTLALLRRDVRLSLAHDGRVALTLPPVADLRSRLGGVWGAGYAERLVDVEHLHGSTHVCGLVERPTHVGSATRRVFLAVNGRAVRDAGVVRAAEAAFRSTIPSGARPALFLELVLSADDVDVNVHPGKAEVRFRERWWVERAVENAVRRALGTEDSAAGFGGWRVTAEPVLAPVDVDVEVLRSASQAAHTPLFGSFGDTSTVTAGDVDIGSVTDRSVDEQGVGTTPSGAQPLEAPALEVPPLLQLRRTYIMFERNDGVVLIDQHAAHERVLYERFMTDMESGRSSSQRLLFPITLHLGPAQGEAFDVHRDTLERLGFEIEGFGGHTLLVRSVPMPHPRFDAERCLRETLDALTGDRHASDAAHHERLAATVACKAAIKAGDPLSAGEMRALYLSLAATRLPAHDVHGRATVVLLSWDEVERRFGRR